MPLFNFVISKQSVIITLFGNKILFIGDFHKAEPKYGIQVNSNVSSPIPTVAVFHGENETWFNNKEFHLYIP